MENDPHLCEFYGVLKKEQKTCKKLVLKQRFCGLQYIEGENRYSARQKQIRLRSVKAAIAGACIVYAISILLIRLTAEKFLLYMDFAESEVIATAILVFLGMNFRREDRKQG